MNVSTKCSKHIGLMILILIFSIGVSGCAGKQNLSLYQAVYNNDGVKASKLIAKGLDPDIVVNDDGLRPVILAAYNGNNAILDMLLKAGADPDASMKNGSCAIHFAAGKKDTALLETLIQYHADVNIQNNAGVPPLYIAAKENNIKAIELLLDAGANASIGKMPGQSPLNVAAYSNHTDAVEILTRHGAEYTIFDHAALNHFTHIKQLVRSPSDANLLTSHKLSLLHCALKNGHMDMARYLISMGADTNQASDDGVLPIHLAALWKDKDMVNLLLENGADVNALQSNKMTPLHMAAAVGNSDMITFLLARGAVINAATRTGETPLYTAASNNHPETVKRFIEKGADIEAEHNGWTPLRIAANRGLKDVVTALITAPNIRIDDAEDGATALYEACYKGRRDIAEILLNAGADPSKGYNGWSCLHSAVQSGSLETVLLLLENGADVRAFIPKTNIKPMDIAYDQLKDIKVKENMLTLLTGYYGEVRLANVRRSLGMGSKDEALIILKDIQGYYGHHAQQSMKRIKRLQKKMQGLELRQRLASSLKMPTDKKANENGTTHLKGETYTHPAHQSVESKTAYLISREKAYETLYEFHRKTYKTLADCIELGQDAGHCLEEIQ